jgi:hypothetical protein
MALITFTTGTTAVAADVNSNFTYNRQQVFLLGNGSGTTTTSGVSTLGSFTTGRTITHGIIVFDISWQTSGSACSPGLDIVGGTSASPFGIGGTAANNGTSSVRGYQYTTDVFSWIGVASGGPSTIYSENFGVTSANDTIYVKVDKAGTGTTTYKWRAYLIADTEA